MRCNRACNIVLVALIYEEWDAWIRRILCGAKSHCRSSGGFRLPSCHLVCYPQLKKEKENPEELFRGLTPLVEFHETLQTSVNLQLCQTPDQAVSEAQAIVTQHMQHSEVVQRLL